MANPANWLFNRKLWMPGWGEIALSALQLALISGMLLIPVFLPGETAFRSLSQLVASGFIGRLLHSFHSYAGDIFLLATGIHLIEYLYKKEYRSYVFKSWFVLLVLGVISLLVVFSGFLSIGSKESVSAQHILVQIMTILGALGRTINHFLMSTTAEQTALSTIYLHHAATFSILGVILTYMHLRRLKAEPYTFYYTMILLLVLAVVLPAQIGQPASSPAAVVKGPWYFIGLQEALSWTPVWVAGILPPAVALILLSILPVLRQSEKAVLYALGVLGVFYLFETIVGWFFRGEGWQLLLK